MNEFDIRKTELEQQLAELKALKERLTSVDKQEQEFIAPFPIKLLKEELKNIDSEIKEIKSRAKQTAKEYTELEKQLKKQNEQRERSLEGNNLLRDDEIMSIQISDYQEKIKINKLSSEIKGRYNELQKLIKELNRKRKEIIDRMERSEALGLSTKEYNLIYSTIKNRKLFDALYKEEGLDSITAKKESRRTKEEKELLNKAKDRIIMNIGWGSMQINGVPPVNEESILKSIEAVYLLDTKVKKGGKPRKLGFQQEDIINMGLNDQEYPHKIKDSSITSPVNIVEDAPKDMKDAKENEKVDINSLTPPKEKITLFLNKDTSDYYVRKYAVDKFALTSADKKNEVRINGSTCYKISEEDVRRIKECVKQPAALFTTDIKEIDKSILNPRNKKDGETPLDYIHYLTDYYKKNSYEIKDYETVKEEPEAQTPAVDTDALAQTPAVDTDALAQTPAVDTDALAQTPAVDTDALAQTPAVDTKQEVIVPEPESLIGDKDGEGIDAYNALKSIFPEPEAQTPAVDTKQEVIVPEPESLIGDKDGRRIDGFNPFKSIVQDTEPEITVQDTEPEITIPNSQPGIEPDEITGSEPAKVTEKEISDIVDNELGKIEPTEKDITDIVNAVINNNVESRRTNSKEELAKILKEVPASSVQDEKGYEPTNVEASEDFKEELASGNVSYNVSTSKPKLVQGVIAKVRSLFDPLYDYDEPEEHHSTK